MYGLLKNKKKEGRDSTKESINHLHHNGCHISFPVMRMDFFFYNSKGEKSMKNKLKLTSLDLPSVVKCCASPRTQVRVSLSLSTCVKSCNLSAGEMDGGKPPGFDGQPA